MTRRAPVRPTSRARIVEARAGRPGRLDPARARRELVPSDRFRKADDQLSRSYHGARMSPRAKRAAVTAAGAAPFVGDFAAAATAARLAPPEQRKGAAATQFAGSQGGGLAGTAAGAYGLSQLAARNNRIAAASERVNSKINSAKEHIPGRARFQATGRKVGDAARTRFPRPPGASAGRAGRAFRAFKAPISRNPAAAAVGGIAGSMVGAQAGGYAAYSHVLHREKVRNSQLEIVGKRQVLTDGVVLNSREQANLRRRKRASASASTVTGTLGLAALAATGGHRVRRLSPVVRGRLKSAQTPLLTASAGIGGANSLLGASIQRREAGVHKASAWGPRPRIVPPTPAPAPVPGLRRRRTYGASYLQRRPSGVVRVAAGVR